MALYAGGMGSREQNFYNRLVVRYGFAAAAAEIQDHYLAGRYDGAMAAVPAALIDAVCLCGPPAAVHERLQAYARAGTTTLCVAPVAADAAGRCEQLRRIAQLAP